MDSRERVLRALNHEEADRIPTFYDAPWQSTIDRWHREGLSPEVTAAQYFDWDIVLFKPDTTPMFPVNVMEEDDRIVIQRTAWGSVTRERKDAASVPETIEPPCKTREDWEKIKRRLVPSRDRVDWRGEIVDLRGRWPAGLEGYRSAREAGKFVCFNTTFGVDKIPRYVGFERLMELTADDPDWVRDMYEADASLGIGMCEVMKEGGFEFDGAFIGCDLGWRGGLLFSPRTFQEQLRPTFQRLLDYFNSQEMPVILHSDGDVRELIPYFVEDGVACLQPLEAKAGMDLVELKQEWGDRLAFAGGIDARAMADPDPTVIEEEIRRKITVAKRGGGYIYCVDHSVPNDVSFAQYERVLRLVTQYGGY